MSFANDPQNQLDCAVADVVNEPLDPRTIEQAAARVWGRLSAAAPEGATADTAATAPQAHAQVNAAAAGLETTQGAARAATPTQGAATAATPNTPLRTCDDYARLIPAYLAGELTPARALLVEDHARGCITCRRALRAARTGEAARAPLPAAAPRFGRRAGLALAASLTAAVGLSSFFLVRELGFGGGTAQVVAVEGHLLEVAGQTVQPLAAGARFEEGEQVRTAKGSHAVLRLADGSLVEMNERSALSYDARRSGTTIDLDQGRIIVQAAKQTEGRHLYVATDDCRVAVVGTIFSVNHGTKGSRVSVIEGRVRVARSGHEDVLDPGQQVATRAAVAAVPVAQEVAWSQEAPRYRALLAELTALGREVDAQVSRPGLRTSTRLLDLAPAGTMIYVALPNLAANLADTQHLLDQRLAENPVLAKWWADTLGTGERAERFRETVDRLGSLGRYLGDELAIAFSADGPVALAEVRDPAAFRAALEQEAARLTGDRGEPLLRLVDGPAAVAGLTTDDVLLVWVRDDLLVAAPKAELLARMGESLAEAVNPFTQTAFHDKVAAVYGDGAGWLFAGDLKALIHEGQHKGELDRTAEKMGILDLDHVIVDRRDGEGGRTETRATLTFDRPRRGIAAWLASPGPMGALSFISPDANLAASFVVRDPAGALDDLLATAPELRDKLESLRAEHGFDLRELAAALGGEVAFALDGPVLPTPSWKLIAEVYDPARVDRALEDLVTRLDAESRTQGHGTVSYATEQAGGRTYHVIRHAGTGGSGGSGGEGAGAGFEAWYVIADGYLVAAPSRALLESTLRQRESGNTLVASAKFQALLPADKQVNFSALVYHDLGSALQPLAGAAGRLAQGAEGGPGVPGGSPVALLASGPSLLYAYGEEDRILFAGNSEASLLGSDLGTLVGLGGLFGAADPAGEQPVHRNTAVGATGATR